MILPEIKKRNNCELAVAIFVILVIFVFNPTIGLILAFIYILMSNSPGTGKYLLFAAVLAGWLGVINMTKIPASDQIYYAQLYNRIDESDILRSIWDYRPGTISSREIFFNIFSVLCHILFRGNLNGYFFSLTFVIYFCFFAAIVKFYKGLRANGVLIIAGFILLAFFTPFFSQTIHACRQFLASAFLFYALSYRSVKGKNNWLFLGLAFFTHNSSLFFVLLSLFPQFYHKWNWKTLTAVILGFSIFVAFYMQIGTFLAAADVTSISSVGQRLADAGNSTEKDLFSLRGLNIYATPLALCGMIIIWRNYKRKITDGISFAYFFFLTYIFILAFSFAPTIQFRYTFYVYCFLPFLIVPVSMYMKLFFRQLYCILLSIAISYRFFFVDDWGWHYAPLSSVVMDSFLTVLNTSYYHIY